MQRNPSRPEVKYTSLPSGDHCGAVSQEEPSVTVTQELSDDRDSLRYGATITWERPESMRAMNAIARSSGEKRACIRLYRECCRICMRSCDSSLSKLMVCSFCGE